jgi:hypothetical protein
VGPRAGLNRCGKFHPPPRFDPRTVQPVASRYTGYAARPIPLRVVHINYNEYLFKFPIRKLSASVEMTAFAPLSGKILVSGLSNEDSLDTLKQQLAVK